LSEVRKGMMTEECVRKMEKRRREKEENEYLK